MESASVYEQTTIIHELTQGIEMAKQLRHNLNSAEARQFLIKNILSSYDKALFLLKSPGQPRACTLPALPESSLPKSSTSTYKPESREFDCEFDQNVVSKKRKLSPPSPEKHETTPTNHHHEPPSFFFPSPPFGLNDDDFHFPNLDEDLMPVYSPPYNHFINWDTSPSFDLDDNFDFNF